MAAIRSNSAFPVVLESGSAFFQQKLAEFKEARARRKIYKETYAELASMSDRGLKDMGFSRSEIRRLAMEAAYDV